ncbi:MAG: NUDIX domain-containing protein [bacterium]
MPAINCQIVEICVFKKLHDSIRYLLLKRSADDVLYPGIWQLVTGMMEPSETAVLAALRELSEETGLEFKNIWVVPFVNSFYVVSSDTVHLSVFFAVEVDSDSDPRLSTEHQAWVWSEYEEAQKTLIWPGQKHALELTHHFIIGSEGASQLVRVDLSK